MDRARGIVETDDFARLMGVELVGLEADRAVVRMPYRPVLGGSRIHGGAISALVDIAATAAFWADERLDGDDRGATVDFTIHFLNLSDGVDLTADARLRRRGGQLCVADVVVADPDGREAAVARVTYKLSRSRS